MTSGTRFKSDGEGSTVRDTSDLDLLRIRLSHRRLRNFVLSSLDFGEFKRFDGSIYRNLFV